MDVSFVEFQMHRICDQPWPNDVIYVMRRLFDMILGNLDGMYPGKCVLIKETWRLTQEDGWGKDDHFYKEYTPENIDSWKEDMQGIKKEIRYMWPTLRFKLGRRKPDIETSVGLVRAIRGDEADPNPIPNRSERCLRISFPRDIFIKMDQSALTGAFGTICAELGATYAVIDEWENAHAHDMQHYVLELYSAIPPTTGPQITLPNLAWWQYIAPPMGEKTGTLEMIREKCPCFKAQLYSSDGKKGLGIQLSETLQDTTYDQRLNLRTFFKDSLKPLSLEEMAEGSWQRPEALDLVPLTDDERREVLDRMKAYDKRRRALKTSTIICE